MHTQVAVTNSADETLELGKSFASLLRPGDVVCLFGVLGVGKTTFVKGLALGFGIKREILSPTFIVLRTYDVDNNGIKKVYHFDLYRLHDQVEVKGIGFDEIIADKQGLVVIEWPEKIAQLLPDRKWSVSFEYLKDAAGNITQERKIAIQSF